MPECQKFPQKVNPNFLTDVSENLKRGEGLFGGALASLAALLRATGDLFKYKLFE